MILLIESKIKENVIDISCVSLLNKNCTQCYHGVRNNMRCKPALKLLKIPEGRLPYKKGGDARDETTGILL